MQFKKENIVGTFILTSISIFLYMGYKIGVFKFDKNNYISYNINFSNASGLTKKADVRIAGVKVGWVESLNLTESNSVTTKITVLSQYKLAIDTQAYIKQDGIFSIKFIELIPGKNSIVLKKEQFLNQDLSPTQPNLEDLISSVNKVLKETLKVTSSVKNIIEDKDIIYKIKDSLESASLTTKVFNKFIAENQDKVESIIQNLYKLSKCAPSVIKNTDKIINRFSESSENILNCFEKTEKKEPIINNIYELISGTKSFVDKFNNISIGVDNNYQGFLGLNGHKNFESLLNFWFHPNDRFYFIAGTTFSKDRFLIKKEFNQDPKDSLMLNLNKENNQNSFLFNLQTGGYFLKYFGARIGLFRSTPGFALDLYLPVFRDKFKLVSTLEAFDFTGKNRLNYDNKPQFRFINRLFFTPNFYLSFGLNDFASSKNISGFFGLAVDFGDTFFKSKN